MKDSPFLLDGATQAAALLRTLGNKHRMMMPCWLNEYDEMTVGSLYAHLPTSQSALSQRLSNRREEGLITLRRESQTALPPQ